MIHLQPAIRFNGGGHINHAIFWQVLCPKEGGNQPTGALSEQINKDFGSFDKMVVQLSNASVGVQGSGWGWLGYNRQDQRLQIATCSNQDPLQATTGKRNKTVFLSYYYNYHFLKVLYPYLVSMFGNMHIIFNIKMFVLITLKQFFKLLIGKKPMNFFRKQNSELNCLFFFSSSKFFSSYTLENRKPI